MYSVCTYIYICTRILRMYTVYRYIYIYIHTYLHIQIPHIPWLVQVPGSFLGAPGQSESVQSDLDESTTGSADGALPILLPLGCRDIPGRVPQWMGYTWPTFWIIWELTKWEFSPEKWRSKQPRGGLHQKEWGVNLWETCSESRNLGWFLHQNGPF